MPAACRLGDLSTGHDCFPSRANTTATSGNVFINGLSVHMEGDVWNTHCCGPVCHQGNLVGGSETVFINGRKVSRIGDSISCGDTVASGSPNVFVGG